jgi:lysosomal acid lipase/cholesteryl ester hydrolase
MQSLVAHVVTILLKYVLSTTGTMTLTYIGFSQGTAQAFAGLSMKKELQAKINLFIALAPATKPKGNMECSNNNGQMIDIFLYKQISTMSW